MSEGLVEWLRAQILIDEKIAQAASPGPWDAAHGSTGSGVYMYMDGIVANLVMAAVYADLGRPGYQESWRPT